MRPLAAGPLAAALLIAAGACGTEDVELSGRSGDGGAAGCFEDGPECNNCVDDDGDGLIDGFDPHCISSLDDREDSFETGIPGDNMNEDFQDCFFDGNSGSGDDGCRQPTCCLFDPDAEDCPPPSAPSFVSCEPDDICVETCGPKTPPGCDCFGCCTVCSDAGCFDVVTHPTVAPECDLDGLEDPERCPRCEKSASCGTSCSEEECVLCPGQTEDDLPADCEEAACPDGLTRCAVSTDCAADEFCSNGCCIAQIE